MSEVAGVSRVDGAAVVAAADRLADAAESRVPCAPVRDLIAVPGVDEVESAYGVQRLLTERRCRSGVEIVGRKVGLTAPAVQRQLGVDQPDFGVLFDDMWCAGDRPVPTERLLQPKIEAEVAFVLGADLLDGDVDVERVRAAVDYAVAALEIVDSRIAGWDIGFADTVADNASSGLFVLGSQRVGLDVCEPVDVCMSMSVDGPVVSEGAGVACLGDPLNALAWLARTAAAFGEPLRAGQVVLSGALGPMVPVTAGSRVVAEISSLGTVTASFA